MSNPAILEKEETYGYKVLKAPEESAHSTMKNSSLYLLSRLSKNY